MPFDPDAYLAKPAAGGFDPDAYLKSSGPAPIDPNEGLGIGASPALDQLMTAAVAAGQGVTGGFSDEIAGGMRALAGDQSYREARDQLRGDTQELAARNPATYMSANLAGAIGGPLNKLPGGSLAQGAVMGLGDAKELDIEGAKDVAKSALLGGAVNAAGHIVADVASGPLAKSAADALSNSAVATLVKDSLRPIKSQLKGVVDSDTFKQYGEAARNLLDQGIVKPTQTRRDLLQEVVKKRREVGGQLDQFITPDATLNRETLAQMLASRAEQAGKASKVGESKAFDRAANDTLDLTERELPIENLRNLRQSADDASNLGVGKVDKSQKQVADFYRNAEEELVPAESQAAYKDVKTQYSKLKTAEDPLRGSAVSELNGKSSAIKSIGDIAKAPLNPLLNRYPQAKAWGLNVGANILRNPQWATALESASTRGGNAAVASTHFILMQRDPEYRHAYQADQDREMP